MFIENETKYKWRNRMEIEYFPFCAEVGKEAITSQVVESYIDIFADAPWHEWLKCSVCGEYWGKKDSGLLVSMGYMHCGQALVDYWPRVKVYNEIINEIQRPGNSSCWLAMEKDTKKIVGFCWGYIMSIEAFIELVGLDFDISLAGLNSMEELVAHQNEVGVLPEFRGKKIAKRLVALRNQDFIKMGISYGVVRTRQLPEPSVTFNWYKDSGYEILASYPEKDGKVVMGGLLVKLI